MFFDRRLRSHLLASVSIGAMLASTHGLANPTGPSVTAGNVTVGGLGTQQVIVDNGSMRSIVEWDGFSIGTGESTVINQISVDAAILNRVTGPDMSEIYGSLTSNGQVFLINQNGIVIGASGQIETGGFVASTLDVSNADFLGAGEMVFAQGIKAGNGITVHGKIRSVSGGDIFLLSREITIGAAAEIDAGGGYVGLGAGEEILLRPLDTGDGRISIRAGSGRVSNAGTVSGTVAELKAAGGNAYALAINNTGVVRATGVSRRGGRVMLSGGGKVRHTGSIKAARKVVVRSKVKVENRGTVNAGDGQNGGKIVFEAPQIVVEAGSLLDVSAALGGGRMFIGGGYQGSGASRSGEVVDISENARSVTVEAGAVLSADATETGDGGEVIVWADGTTSFMGDITAQALGASGDGGFVEVSGKQHLIFNGTADLRANNGAFGMLLLDPGTVNVSTAADAQPDTFNDAVLSAALAAANVTITTAAATGVNGVALDVNFLAGVRVIWNAATTLAVHAGRDINALDNVIISNTQTGIAGGPYVSEGVGGVDFRAGRDINIGSTGATVGGVAIGSEFGITRMVAGDTDFNGTPNATGDVNVVGGTVALGRSARIGYTQTASRGNNTGNDIAADDLPAVNGDIVVRAGRHVNVTGGNAGSLAQIGHGGVSATLSVAAIVSSSISVTAGEAVSGNVTLTGGVAAFFLSSEAKIGHGSQFGTGAAVTIGDISGDISVTAVMSDINLNTTFTASSDGSDDLVHARIGHGATVWFSGSGFLGTEVTHGKISGDITLDASGSVNLGTTASATTVDDRYWILSQVGHGGFTRVAFTDGGTVTGDSELRVDYDRIAEFEDLSLVVETTDISVTAAAVNVIAQETTRNSGAATDRMVDNLQRSQIGHGSFTAMTDESVLIASGNLSITINESDIAGDITVLDDTQAGSGILVDAKITATSTYNTTVDTMIARIGHATASFIETPSGGTAAGGGVDGADLSIAQANILGARIDVRTGGAQGDNEDITVSTLITAATPADVIDNTAVAQIGHSGDIVARTGAGGDGPAGNFNSGNAGDVLIYKGTVWDGLEHFGLTGGGTGTYGDNGGQLDDDGNSSDDGNTDIVILSSNQILVDSDTRASGGSGLANRNNAESSIGHGAKFRLATRDGGDNSTNAGTAAGGRGGDITISQLTPGRDFDDGTNTADDDTARGLRGEIVLEAVHTADASGALILSATNAASGTASTNNNSDFSTIGHGDIIETFTGDGADGGTSANVSTAQVESYGGRGGHVFVNLSNMLIESDIQLQPVNVAVIGGPTNRGGITGEIEIISASNNALSPANRDIVQSVIGHGQRIFATTGVGGNGGSANFLANATAVFASETTMEAFRVGPAGSGAARGGNGGDIKIDAATITDRQGTAGVGSGLTHDEEADIHVVVTGNNTAEKSLTITASVGSGLSEGTGADIFSGIGHRDRLFGEGGTGGTGGSTNTEFDDFIQPNASGGRGGDVRITDGNIEGDIVVDVTRQVSLVTTAGHGTTTKVLTQIGHTTDVVAVTQNGGNGGNLYEPPAGGTSDGGIDAQDSGIAITLIDGNDDDEFDLTGVTDSGDATNEDGVEVAGTTTGADTMASIATGLGRDPNTAGNALFFDEEADPEYIRDAADATWILNNAGNAAERANAANILLFGRTVGGYGIDIGETDMFVDLNPTSTTVAVDLVDFDRDGRIDIVDVDKDGIYDKIDGRAVFVNAAEDPNNGIGILDYRVASGAAYDQTHLEGGWTLTNQLSTTDATGAVSSTALVGDFSTANGGRGGDAFTKVGYTLGDIAVDTGDPVLNSPDSLQVMTIINDGTGGSEGDLASAVIGHGAFQWSDSDASYAGYRAGREIMSFTVHVSAVGGAAGNFAITAVGGRGGDAKAIQGVSRDNDPTIGVQNELDHLVGGVYVNVPDEILPGDLRIGRANQSDAKRIVVSTDATLDTGGRTIGVSRLGHGAGAIATAENTGGVGASDGGSGPTSSQTEIADGGRGGDGTVTQEMIKGLITVMTGADDGPTGSGDFSIKITATKGTGGGDLDRLIAQIGHGRLAQAFGGDGGAGDDGQYMANGGRGGNGLVSENEIIDTGITVTTVDVANGYFGNGLKVKAVVDAGSDQIVRAQIGHSDVAGAFGGAGGNGSAGGLSNVIEQINQTANGGDGGSGTVTQQGYGNDIIVIIGPGTNVPEALQVISSVDNAGGDNLALGAIGHGGYGTAGGGLGGNGGNRNGTYSITSGDDANQRDGVDSANRMTLGTDRNGGDGGAATVNLASAGIGRYLTGRSALDFGIDDTNGADITINLHDDLSGGGTGVAAFDGALIQATSGDGDTEGSSLFATAALVGHHGFAAAINTGAAGGDAIQTTLSATISEGNGGDGGAATSNIGFIYGDVRVSNALDGTPSAGGSFDTDIIVRSVDRNTSGSTHRAEARIGHLVANEALAADGGMAADPISPNPSYGATISAQGGDGGDATATEAQVYGIINLFAENSIVVTAADGATGSTPLLNSAIGHRLQNRAEAGAGALGGEGISSGSENLYFIYEALREYEAKGRVLANLSIFERKLIAPFIDYFSDKDISAFLTKMVRVAGRDSGGGVYVPFNNRDDDYVGNTDFTIPALAAEEIQTMIALMSASGDGGKAAATQGSTIPVFSAINSLAAAGAISLTAYADYTADAARGIIISASDNSVDAGMQIAHVGHQAEVIRALGGAGGGVRSYSPSIGGDGGSATVTQRAAVGNVRLTSVHKITVSATDSTLGAARQRARVGHRLTIGSDRDTFRTDPIVVGGQGGDELSIFDNGYNGNGGNVVISQYGATGADQLEANIWLLGIGNNTDDGISIAITSSATGLSAPDAETHVGHDFLIASVKAGDAGRQNSLKSPAGLDKGVREGNGGDITVYQYDLGADINIDGDYQVLVTSTTSTSGVNEAHTIVGHQRTIGDSSDTENDYSGTIVAGNGGDSIIEDYNDTLSGPGGITGAGDVEDADGGSINITLGFIGDDVDDTDDPDIVTITSLTEDVDILSSAAFGQARTEIGNEQHVIAAAGEGGLQQGITAQTAGEGGEVNITRPADMLTGDITVQALDRGSSAGSKEVKVEATGSALSETQIGHETNYDITAGKSGLGEQRDVTLSVLLTAFTGLADAGTGAAGDATLRDANMAVTDMTNVVAIITMANKNAFRYPAADVAVLATALTAATTALTTANTAFTNLAAGTITEIAAVNAIKAEAVTSLAALTLALTAVTNTAAVGGATQLADHADAGDITYGGSGALNGNVNLISGRDTDASGSADSFNGTGAAVIVSAAGTGTTLAEVGHRSVEVNNTLTGGDGGDAGDGGSITIATTVAGDVSVQADKAVIRSSGSGAETHLLHSADMTNQAEKSDNGSKLGSGGDITATQTVSGAVAINVNHLSSVVGGENSILSSTGSAALTQLGHQVMADNDSLSDNGTENSNRGGAISFTQSVSGNAAGDLVTLNLAIDGPGARDVTVYASGGSTTRLGSTVAADSFSGGSADDGGPVTSTQTISGDLETSAIEDLLLDAASGDIFLGHDGVHNAQSGSTNNAGNEYGEAVVASQTVTGDLNIDPGRSFQAVISGGSGEIHVGHEATQLAKSANDTATPPDGTNNDTDVTATQLVQAEIGIVTGEILLETSNTNRVQIGHEAFHTIDTDVDGMVEASSRINPADAGDRDDIVISALGTAVAEADTTVAPAINGDINLHTSSSGEVQVGHRSTSTVSSGAPVGNGTFDTEQAIGGGDADADGHLDLNADGTVADTASSTITVNTLRDLRLVNDVGGTTQVGHFITEAGALSGAAAAAMPGSGILQAVGSDIVAGDGTLASATGIGNSLTLVAGAGRAEIGHRSPASNEFQVTGGVVVTPQILDGDITLEVGIDAGGAIDGATMAGAGAGDDDVRIVGMIGVARIGHNQTSDSEASGNTVQVSAGDIFVRARSDLHVNTGAIGHEHYDFLSPAIDTQTAVAGAGAIRNRIRGNTTIGAGQNSPLEDSMLTANVMRFDGTAGASEINSGYGGIGNADVDGELRFFIPAQQNLTIINPVTFNDSGSSADNDFDRAADASNIFTGQAGLDHEENFTAMSVLAPYSDAKIGAANFAFYFESEPITVGETYTPYTPYINIIDLDGGFEVIYSDPETGNLVNSGLIGDGIVVGTGSFDIYCEEAGLPADVCEQISIQYAAGNLGYGSSTGFPGTGGGNQTFDNNLVETGVNGTSAGAFAYAVNPAYATMVLEIDISYRKPSGMLQLIAFVPPIAGEKSRKIVIPEDLVAKRHVEEAYSTFGGLLVTGYSPFPAEEDSYGEYLRGRVSAAAEIRKEFGDVISFASAYEIYVGQEL